MLNLSFLIGRVFSELKERMSWFIIVLILNLTFSSFSEARHAKKLPTPVVVGTVYCDTCFQNDFSRNSHFIEGEYSAS